MCKNPRLPSSQGAETGKIRWTRTANAGGLLELDGVSVLLDGICGGVGPYLPTPPRVLDRLMARSIDLMAFTHSHQDHFSGEDVRLCLSAQKGAAVLGPRDVADALSPYPAAAEERMVVGPVTVTPIPSRHIGAACRKMEHYSFLLEGSRRCLFMGDAAPVQWKDGCPDVLFAPFAYAATGAGWRMTERLSPKRLVLLHMPGRDNDPEGLWQAVEGVLSRNRDIPVDIPDIGETVTL
ncbi:MAG: MBL fold metallo-hydrolase [Oscillibacter sp.]|nr:MBL fold metallo-hydrolase [Oscillibacter sp.]